jgi:acyl-CoA thioester hydrolase
MTKPAPYLLQPETYPFRTMIQTRYADLDANNHLNNVAIAALFEEGRMRLSMGFYDARVSPSGAVVAAANYSYVREGVYGVDVEMAAGIAKIGNTSWIIHAAAFQNGAAIATCHSTTVHIANGAPAPLPEAWRDQLARYLITAP